MKSLYITSQVIALTDALLGSLCLCLSVHAHAGELTNMGENERGFDGTNNWMQAFVFSVIIIMFLYIS